MNAKMTNTFKRDMGQGKTGFGYLRLDSKNVALWLELRASLRELVSVMDAPIKSEHDGFGFRRPST